MLNNYELMMELQNVVELSEAVTLCTDNQNKDMFVMWGKEAGYTVKVLNDVWKAAQPAKAKGTTGWQEAYQDWLVEDSRTEYEALTYLMGQSKNVQKHITNYLGLWALAESVRSGTRIKRTLSAKDFVATEESEPEAEEMRDDVKQAWDDLKAEMSRAKPRKTKVHPDKVSHLNDEALTTAYKEAFQSLNTKKRK